VVLLLSARRCVRSRRVSHQSKRKHRAVPAGPPPESRKRLRISLAVNRLFSRAYHRVEVQTPSTLPKTGPAILVCNHISALDPLLLQGTTPRVVIWMMAREFYEIRAMRWFFEIIEAIPVDRSGRDMAATRAALRALENGRVLGIFPEGRIETTHELLPFQTGVAMMAIRAGVPVCPAYLDGTNRGMEMLSAVLTPNEARLRFGPLLHLTTPPGVKPDLDISTGQIRAAIENLRQEMELERKR
jgi:1-acyl-sn-glycerol-3-phosphate acyltransferase